ncbi:MAG: 23S rRNA (pseudouridine(1915)-N(3))-methyltransferase RlmH [Pseudomonadota bacterium]
MPRLRIVAVGSNLPAWARSARDEYLRRMPRGFEVTLDLLKPSVQKKLLEKIPKHTKLVALDEHGKDLTTREFAKLLGEPATFVIGGPDGLDPEIRARAALLVRLSSLTLPHALAQVLLAEQLYRAATLLTGHPYHRE